MIHQLSLPGFNSALLLAKLGASEKHAALFTSGTWTIVTWNPVDTLTLINDESLQKLEKRLHQDKKKSSLPFIGGAIGYFSYDLGLKLLNVRSKHFADGVGTFHFYDQAVLFDGNTVRVVGSKSFAKDVQRIWIRPSPVIEFPRIDWKPNISKTEYKRGFEKIQRAIHDGDVYQMNYTYQMIGETKESKESPPDPNGIVRVGKDSNELLRSLFAKLHASNPAPAASYFESEDQTIISLSPERFITIDRAVVTTSPMKGTRPRGKNPAEDRKMRAELLKSEKEQAELNMITDLLRNDLGQVCEIGSVRVINPRVLQKNPSVWHAHSVIEGKLEPRIAPARRSFSEGGNPEPPSSVIDVFKAMLPGGSITGCPKKSACEHIDQLEKSSRGPYCGVMAMISDSGFVDSSILIRTIMARCKPRIPSAALLRLRGDGKIKLSLGVGGGIVADSKWKDEYAETLAKAKTFFIPAARVRLPAQGSRGSRTPAAALAAFETLRTYGKNIFLLDAHLKRLKKSAKILGFVLPKSLPEIAKQTQHAVKNFKSYSQRIRIVADKNDVRIECEKLVIPKQWKTGIKAMFVHAERPKPQAKALPFNVSHRAHQAALDAGYDEALLVDRNGYVTEGAYSNVFWVKDGVLCTPNKNILEGITRGVVLLLARKLKIPVRFKNSTKTELLNADELFLTKTTTGITPALFIENVEKKEGFYTRRLRRDFPHPLHQLSHRR